MTSTPDQVIFSMLVLFLENFKREENWSILYLDNILFWNVSKIGATIETIYVIIANPYRTASFLFQNILVGTQLLMEKYMSQKRNYTFATMICPSI